MSPAEETNLMHAWWTGRGCRCGKCYCCGVFEAHKTQPKSYADVDYQQHHKAAQSWNAYMYARLNNY